VAFESVNGINSTKWWRQIVPSPNSTCCIALRHVTTRQPRHVVGVVTWRDLLCVLCRACSNMTDDEEAVVLACKTISCFFIIYYFSSQMKLIRLLAIIILYTLQSCVSRLSRSPWRACRASCDGRVALVALVATFCVTFPVPKCMG